MLVLSRKNNESVIVGGCDTFRRIVKVTVLEISGGRVRLGFDVESDVPVHRLEIWEKIQAGGKPQSSLEPPATSPAFDTLSATQDS